MAKTTPELGSFEDFIDRNPELRTGTPAEQTSAYTTELTALHMDVAPASSLGEAERHWRTVGRIVGLDASGVPIEKYRGVYPDLSKAALTYLRRVTRKALS